MRVEEEKVSHVHMLCPKVGLTDKNSGEQMLPLTSQELLLYSVSEALGLCVSVCGQVVDECMCMYPPKAQTLPPAGTDS